MADGNIDLEHAAPAAAPDGRDVVEVSVDGLARLGLDGPTADGRAEVRPAPDGDDGDDGDVEVLLGKVQRAPPADASDDELTNADFGGSDDAEVVVVNYEDRLVEALPDLARLAAAAGTRTVSWGLRLGLRATARVARATVDPQVASEVAHGASAGMRAYAREFLGIADLEDRVRLLTPVGDRFAGAEAKPLSRGEHDGHAHVAPDVLLRAQGAELLRQSADVTSDDHLHPAFGRILGELAPDEGRILRLLTYEGPQPVVDVRAANLIGVGSQLVAQNLNMVAMQAGCRHADRVATYLTNLQRLGLVCFADKPLSDEMAYQVLEAQPHVLEAIKSASRAKTVQRSLRLTPFGEEFCCACFPRDYAEAQELSRGRDRGTLPSADHDLSLSEDEELADELATSGEDELADEVTMSGEKDLADELSTSGGEDPSGCPATTDAPAAQPTPSENSQLGS